jgi:hypothetical protein
MTRPTIRGQSPTFDKNLVSLNGAIYDGACNYHEILSTLSTTGIATAIKSIKKNEKLNFHNSTE